MDNESFLKAEDVAKELGISKSQAYKVIRNMNKELESKGYMTIIGRVSRYYFQERFYGMRERQ